MKIMILGVSHTVLLFSAILFILAAFILNHMSYVLITTSMSSAHNGVHLISVKLCRLLLLFKFCLQSDCNLHTDNQLCMSYVTYSREDSICLGYYIFVDTKLCAQEMHSHVFVYTFKVNRTSFVVCIVIF